MLVLFLSSALAGYGDPVAGLPTAAERELHAWTDLARVDVSTFASDLPCWGELTDADKASHAPLAWNEGLAEAARAHTEDMAASGRMTHRSSDGTKFADRLWSYYDGFKIAENVARGYRTPRSTVVAWLCSEGHRANLLGNTRELGTGNVGRWWTQDFGASRKTVLPALRMGAHTPAVPDGSVTLLADVEAPARPTRVVAILDGVRHPMSIEAGSGGRAVWSVDVDVDGGCHWYRFTTRLSDGTHERFPASGAYGFGACPWTDPEAQWLDDGALAAVRSAPVLVSATVAPIEDDDDTAPAAPADLGDAIVAYAPTSLGCATVPATAISAWASVVGLLALRRRRR